MILSLISTNLLAKLGRVGTLILILGLKMSFKSLFGKYRFLVISIALFLIFDLGVLVLNFYTSGKIAEQTELINLAGRQRTLTQQMSKATLYIKSQKLQQWVYQSGLDEFRDHFDTFDKTLDVFNHGGTLASTSTGLPIQIKAVNSIQGLAILHRANALWEEFKIATAPLTVDALVTDDEIKPASAFIATNNLRMFAYMNTLTEHFSESAERQTNLLRRAQVIGISLATINFFIILFHFLGQLRGRDRELQVRQHESDQILSTIDEGVFLLGKDMLMSGQHSRQMIKLFATRKIAGRRFDKFLGRYFPQKVVITAMDFVNLYFSNHIDPRLIEELNPLKRVETSVADTHGESHKKFLDFSFARLDQGDDEPKILVTVMDVTAATLLESQGERAAEELSQKMALLMQILPVASDDLDAFIRESAKGYDHMNTLLKQAKHANDNFARPLQKITLETHKLKGSAASIGFASIAEQLHKLEEKIQEIRQYGGRRGLNGNDLLPLAIQLKANYDDLELITELRNELSNYSAASTQGRSNLSLALTESDAAKPSTSSRSLPTKNSMWANLMSFTERLAKQENVDVDLDLRGFDTPLSPALTDTLYPLAVQLVRNSIAHGIESEDIRRALKKPGTGRISLLLSAAQTERIA